MRHNLLSLLLLLLQYPVVGAPEKPIVKGYVYQQEGRMPLAGVHVYSADKQTGTRTDDKGFFSLAVPAKPSAFIHFSHVGYAPVTHRIAPDRSSEIAIFLTSGQTLTELTVRAGSSRTISDDAQMSSISVSAAQLRKVPALLGEKDALKVLQLMPGVQKGSEGNAGLYVRGGGPDQNLILLDNAPIYNPNHLLGFFSAFNGDVLKRVDLTKGGFPARFGGRLSSVIELTTKDGNDDRLHGEGAIGLVASRLTLEGPIKSRKVSFLVSGRRTYLDLLSGLQRRSTTEPLTKSYFYDLNAKLTITAGAADKIYLSGYTSRDQFASVRRAGSVSLQSGLEWGNAAGSARWNHRTATGISTDLSLIYSQYGMAVTDQQSVGTGSQEKIYSLRYRSGIRDLGIKYDINQYLGDKHQIRYGLQATHHQFTPEAAVSSAGDTLPRLANTQPIDALESGVYVEHYWNPTDRWRINSGIRLSYYQVLGGSRSTQTAQSGPAAGDIRPEPRLSAAYRLSSTLSVKGSYALMNQYVHLLSGTGIGLSTDLWMPTVDHIKPQQSQQVALGLAADLPRSGLTLTAEGYYKQMSNLLSYREGASFVATNAQGAVSAANWTDNVTGGRGWSYGAEFLLQKKTGRLSGWVGYTLSWTQWQFGELNGGRPFNPRYDRRHDASVVGIYELTPSITLAGTWVYGTGNALTMPLSRFSGFTNRTQVPDRPSSADLYGAGTNVKEYGERNGFRAAAYHRLDVSLQFNRKRGNYERTWEFSAYNVYNRRNAFLYSLEGKDQGKDRPSKTVLYKYSLFPIVPSMSYSVRF